MHLARFGENGKNIYLFSFYQCLDVKVLKIRAIGTEFIYRVLSVYYLFFILLYMSKHNK